MVLKLLSVEQRKLECSIYDYFMWRIADLQSQRQRGDEKKSGDPDVISIASSNGDDDDYNDNKNDDGRGVQRNPDGTILVSPKYMKNMDRYPDPNDRRYPQNKDVLIETYKKVTDMLYEQLYHIANMDFSDLGDSVPEVYGRWVLQGHEKGDIGGGGGPYGGNPSRQLVKEQQQRQELELKYRTTKRANRQLEDKVATLQKLLLKHTGNTRALKQAGLTGSGSKYKDAMVVTTKPKVRYSTGGTPTAAGTDKNKGSKSVPAKKSNTTTNKTNNPLPLLTPLNAATAAAAIGGDTLHEEFRRREQELELLRRNIETQNLLKQQQDLLLAQEKLIVEAQKQKEQAETTTATSADAIFVDDDDDDESPTKEPPATTTESTEKEKDVDDDDDAPADKEKGTSTEKDKEDETEETKQKDDAPEKAEEPSESATGKRARDDDDDEGDKNESAADATQDNAIFLDDNDGGDVDEKDDAAKPASKKAKKVVEEKPKPTWDTLYQKVKKFYKKNGHLSIFDDDLLLKWMDAQRVACKKDELTQEQIDQLNEVEFVWET